MLKINGWVGIVATWGTTSFMFLVFLISNILLGIIAGALVGWLVSLTILGNWVNEGIAAFNVKLLGLHKLGALLGFFSGFFKFSISKK